MGIDQNELSTVVIKLVNGLVLLHTREFCLWNFNFMFLPRFLLTLEICHLILPAMISLYYRV